MLVPWAAHAVDLTGAGASTPYPVYVKWAANYHKHSGHRVNYQSMGSGGGQQQIVTGTVDFGATDDPMPVEWLDKHGLVQFPAVIAGIVPVVNIPGLDAGALMLTGDVLAKIYLGAITRWDDTEIAQLNPDVSLPDKDIVVVHRADGSGTTFVWTDYLSGQSKQWRRRVGTGKAVSWPVGQGGKGNEGVAAYVRQLSYSIGYVEYTYAVTNNLAWVALQNHDGHVIDPGIKAFAAAARDADWDTPGMGVGLTNQPGSDVWPIVTASFILVPRSPKRPERTQAVLEFFEWAYTQGQEAVVDLAYVPLPKQVVKRVRAQWEHVRLDRDGLEPKGS